MTDTLLDAIRSAGRELTAPETAHDWSHVLRVESVGASIASLEGADVFIVRASALLHEVFTLPKDHPESHLAGRKCAEVAKGILSDLGVPQVKSNAICYCIAIHAYSAGIEPETREAMVLQDADRLDAIGAIGIARCFATSASMGRPLYDIDDPFAERRDLDDKAFALDHFARKLLKVPDRLHTDTARALGRERAAFLTAYLDQLRREIL